MMDWFYSISWTAVWTSVSAIATAIMAWFTYKSIQNSKEQLAEMKEQWEMENRPIIEMMLAYPLYSIKDGSLALVLKNIGRTTAENVKIEIDKDFINSVPNSQVVEQLKSMSSYSFRILPAATKIINISLVQPLNRNKRYKYQVFGKPLKNEEYEALVSFFKSNSIKVSCTYDKYQFSDVLETNNIDYVERSIEFMLGGIADELDNISTSIRNIEIND